MDFNPTLLNELLYKDIKSYRKSSLSNFRCFALRKSILKKFVSGSTQHLSDAAINDFVERNNNMRDVDYFELNHKTLSLARDILHRIFLSGEWQSNVLTLNSCVQYGYTGPGSSRGTKSTDFVGKLFDSKLTVTSNMLYRHYVSALSPRWLQANFVREANHSVEVVSGNRLSTVPKDSTRERTICTEPSLNMYYQLGAKFVIEDLLRKFYKIDISNQSDKNKLMAKRASIDGALCTIDLKDASDGISLSLCEYLLPKETFNVLSLIRSSTTETPSGNIYKLNMISTMGDGFTFPLMTIILCALAEADHQLINVSLRNGYNFGVFGDDIIIPNASYHRFADLLSIAGFVVNTSKSFFTGNFRESCGGDYFKGHDVRGIYIKVFNNEANVYSAFNRLLRWSVRFDIPLNRTLRYLKGLANFRPIPFDASDDSGFKIPSVYLKARKTTRSGSIYYRSLEPVKRTYKIGDQHVNHYGALLGALGGYVRNQKVNLRARNGDVKYRVVKKHTPCWDFIPGTLKTVWGTFFSSVDTSLQDYVLAWEFLLEEPHN